MPIVLTCDCGRRLRIKDELAGRKVRCPQCSGILLVAMPAAAPDPVEDSLPEPEAEPHPAEKHRQSGQHETPRSARPERRPVLPTAPYRPKPPVRTKPAIDEEHRAPR